MRTSPSESLCTAGLSRVVSPIASLPQELRSSIVALACNVSQNEHKSALVDVATARSLALTSWHFHHQANALLWSAVRLTRPSALISLNDAVAARPELGSLIISLHAGPEADRKREDHEPNWQNHQMMGPDGVWQPPGLMINPSLKAAGAGRISSGWYYDAQQEILHVGFGGAACKSYAVSKALLVIQRCLDVDLTGRDTKRPKSIPRLYEAQAALDIYLAEVERYERSGQPQGISPAAVFPGRLTCKKHWWGCPLYPDLVLLKGGHCERISPASGPEFVLSQEQVQRHISRPGGRHDILDHPILLASRGFDPFLWNLCDSWNSVSSEPQTADPWPPTAAEPINRARDRSRVETTDLQSLTKMLRCLLALAPNLKNLSLSGFLEAAICGNGAPLLEGLQSLALGPPPHQRTWHGCGIGFLADGRGIERLHICGFKPDMIEMLWVCKLDRLKEFRWTLTEELTSDELPLFGIYLDALIGRRGEAANRAAARVTHGASPGRRWDLRYLAAARRNSGKVSSAKKRDGKAAQGSCDPLVEVRLRPAALAAMLDRADDSEQRVAWTTHRPHPAQSRRLLLVRSSTVPPTASYDSSRQSLYEEAQQWWEEQCKRASGGEGWGERGA